MKRNHQTSFGDDGHGDQEEDLIPNQSDVTSTKAPDDDHKPYRIENIIKTIIYSNKNNNDKQLINPQFKRQKCKKCNPFKSFQKAGPFVLGCSVNIVNTAQLSDIENFIAKKIDGDDDNDLNIFYLLKIVKLPLLPKDETQLQRQAKMMLYNEYSILSMFRNQPGIVQVRGLYKDIYFEENNATDSQQNNQTTDDDNDASTIVDKCDKCSLFLNNERLRSSTEDGQEPKDDQEPKHDQKSDDDHNHYLQCKYLQKFGKLYRRLILAFDCHMLHQYSLIKSLISPKITAKYQRYQRCEYENLQEYVKRCKNVNEMKAMKILFEIVKIVRILHRNNVAHRDLRLENILYNHRNEKILLINFSLARYVINDQQCINDYRGSSAYISPDVLKRKPYVPKPSDCWALGVIFYSMLLGKFPFNAETFNELFKKINSGHFDLPATNICSHETMKIMCSLIEIDHEKRLKIDDLYKRLKQLIYLREQQKMNMEMKILIKQNKLLKTDDIQVVPDIDNYDVRKSIQQHQQDADDNDDHVPRVMEHADYHRLKQNEEFKLNSRNHEVSIIKNQSHSLPLPFLRLLDRFCYDPDQNFYSQKYRHYYASPFIDELSKYLYHEHQQQQQSNQLSNSDYESMMRTLNAIQPPKAAVASAKTSTYNVIKVDSDIRPLNDQEYTLINQQLLRMYGSMPTQPSTTTTTSSSPPPSTNQSGS